MGGTRERKREGQRKKGKQNSEKTGGGCMGTKRERGAERAGEKIDGDRKKKGQKKRDSKKKGQKKGTERKRDRKKGQ